MLELIRLVRERNARLILSGDTRQHGAVEASDALLAIERHAGVKPVELHNIRRQDPARGQTLDEREHIKQYRQAVKLAASGKLDESFSQLDKWRGGVVQFEQSSGRTGNRISPTGGEKRLSRGDLTDLD